MMEWLKGWKTVLVGASVAVPLALIEILQQFQFVDMTTILPDPWGQRIALGVSIAMILLRLITSTPVGGK